LEGIAGLLALTAGGATTSIACIAAETAFGWWRTITIIHRALGAHLAGPRARRGSFDQCRLGAQHLGLRSRSHHLRLSLRVSTRGAFWRDNLDSECHPARLRIILRISNRAMGKDGDRRNLGGRACCTSRRSRQNLGHPYTVSRPRRRRGCGIAEHRRSHTHREAPIPPDTVIPQTALTLCSLARPNPVAYVQLLKVPAGSAQGQRIRDRSDIATREIRCPAEVHGQARRSPHAVPPPA
jgi:hypothetical protein